jgi:hypothetical protein
MGVVTTKDDIQGKIKSRGSTCLIMRISFDHANDAYQMLNLRIIQGRDVVCIRKCCNGWLKDKFSSNDIDKDEEIIDSMEEYVILNTKENSIERLKSLKM